MKKGILAVAAAMIIGGFATSASAGVSCAACHAGSKNKMGPSLQSITAAYGSVDEVFAFMNSDAELTPKVEAFAKKARLMKSQLKKYRGMNDEKKAEIRAWYEAESK